MQTVYILVGPSGVGKSTWAKNKAQEEENSIIINKDLLRTMIKDKYTFNHLYEDLIEGWAKTLFRKAIKAGFDVILDETHLTKNSRKSIINMISQYEELFDEEIKIVVVSFEYSDLKTLFERRKNDNKGYKDKNWEDIIKAHDEIYENPKNDKYNREVELICL